MAQSGGRHGHAHVPKIAVSIRDSAVLSVTLLMGVIAIVMCMLGAKAPTACLPEGALLLNVVGTRLVAFEAIRKFGFASLTPLAQDGMALETIFALLNVRWSLSSEDAGDMNSIGGRRSNAVEVRDKSGANSCVSEVAFNHVEFVLSITFSFVKLDSLALYRLELILTCSIPINVSNNPRILEIYDGIVDEKAGGGRWMEDVEVVIFDPRTIEVGSRMCSRIKGNGIFGIATLVSPYKVGVDTNLSKGDIMCHLVLTILIEEDKGVLSRITAIVLAPPVSWMIWVIELFGELGNIGDGTRCRR